MVFCVHCYLQCLNVFCSFIDVFCYFRIEYTFRSFMIFPLHVRSNVNYKCYPSVIFQLNFEEKIQFYYKLCNAAF